MNSHYYDMYKLLMRAIMTAQLLDWTPGSYWTAVTFKMHLEAWLQPYEIRYNSPRQNSRRLKQCVEKKRVNIVKSDNNYCTHLGGNK